MAASTVAGGIIGILFMPLGLITLLGGLATFAGLHVLGGLAGAILGFIVLRALITRKIITQTDDKVASGKIKI
jgi:hypothetical protein